MLHLRFVDYVFSRSMRCGSFRAFLQMGKLVTVNQLPQSPRRVRTGSTREARRAGTYDAMRNAAKSSALTAASTSGSRGLTPTSRKLSTLLPQETGSLSLGASIAALPFVLTDAPLPEAN